MYIPDLEALMKTMIPVHAEHQLAQVANRFDHWRQTRTTPAEPIPHDLWEQAIALTALVPITRVARRLHVSGGELKKRCAAQVHHAAPSTPAPSAALGFVEVPAPPTWPLPTAGLELELHRPDGTRLRIVAQEPQVPLLAVVQACLEML
jgi:hypothetical protein